MRKTIFVLAAALVFTACGGDRPTAPRSSGSQSQLGAAGQSPEFDAVSGGSKPVPAAKFTVTRVNSATANFGAIVNNFGYLTQGTLTATCPMGTTVIGGGYQIGNSNPELLAVLNNAADGSNGWSVKVLFTGTLAFEQATILVTATCLQ